MARDGEQQAMSEKRLREIRRGIEVGQMDMDEDEAFWAIRDLLAEVERQRAENGELREIAACLPVMFQAFQERHNEQRSGGDGA